MTKLIKQTEIGSWACGPCSIAHSLGKEVGEVKDIILELIQTPSWKYDGKKKAYSSDNGITADDIVTFINKKYGKNFSLVFLDRVKEEKGIDFVRRIYNTLKEELKKDHKPIIEIRSFVVTPKKWDYKWYCTIGHFNVIESVQPELEENAYGFSYKFIDSLTGQIEHGYLYFEKYRNYSATKGFTVNALGEEEWQWLTDYPYMVVITPNIHLNTEDYPFQARVITVLKSIMC